MGIFFKDEVQEREVKECEDGQGVMFLELFGRMEELSEPFIIVNIAKTEGTG
ncbi:MAG: hypothetical protein QY317_14575 [Candidatus Jettenia caeni]|nr:MAG: hypothetical protein QY317_14575 [Candidatus Jettenia caeni]